MVCVNGVLVKEQAGIRPVGVNAGKGSCWGKGYQSLSSPSGVPNLLGSGSIVIGVSEGSPSSLSVGFVGSICRREPMGEICW